MQKENTPPATLNLLQKYCLSIFFGYCSVVDNVVQYTEKIRKHSAHPVHLFSVICVTPMLYCSTYNASYTHTKQRCNEF